MRTDQHPVAARFADPLDNETLQIVERVFETLGIAAEMRFDVGNDRFLAQVVADDFGDVGVDAFIVRHAGAGRIHQRDIAAFIGVHDSRHAKQRVLAKYDRVEEVVVDAPVDDVDAT